MNDFVNDWEEDLKQKNIQLEKEVLFCNLYKKALFFQNFFDKDTTISIKIFPKKDFALMDFFKGYIDGNQKSIYGDELKYINFPSNIVPRNVLDADYHYPSNAFTYITNNLEGMEKFYKQFLTKDELSEFNKIILEKMLPSEGVVESKKLKL